MRVTRTTTASMITETLRQKLQTYKGAKARGFQTGSLEAGLLLQREAQEETPVDKGALRASARTRQEGIGFKVKTVVSFGMSYAIWVHEKVWVHHPVGKAKFLTGPLHRLYGRLIEIIIKGMRRS